MKTLKKLTGSLLSIFILFAVLLSTLSCEIGLGASVDTDPPSLSIDKGIADKVVRGDFALRGTWADDGTIDKLSAVLKRTDGTGSSLTFTGTLKETPGKRGAGTWTINIPAKTNSITDGTYQADITIKDATARTTVQSTIFTIDNTAPVIVLTRPTNNDTYGQKFTIEGQAADTNNIDRIEIQLFKDAECTQPAGEAPIVLKQVPLSISMDAASYESADENYIYEGEAADGKTKQFSISVPKDGNGSSFYCKIYAYDGSSRYLGEDDTPADDDDKGNKVDYFYLYKDIYTPILQYYKITELYSILNNTYKEEAARAVTAVTVKADLLDASKYQKKTSYFTLNPKNNPTFTVTGKSPLALDGKDFTGSANEILNGQSVFIEVSPGLDDIPLDEASLKIYVQECDANGKIKTGAQKIYPPATKEEKGTSYRFNVKLSRSEDNSGLKINSCYIFGVEGHDQSDAKNQIEPAGRAYGFRLAASGNAPSLQVITPADAITYIKKDGSQKFTGFVEVEMGTPKLLVYKDNDQDESIIKEIEFTEGQGVKTSTGYKYSFDFDYDTFAQTNKFILKADLGGQLSQPIEKTIVYDVEAPIISITKPTTAKKFTDNFGTEAANAYINGQVEFFVMLNDKGGSGLDTTTEGKKPKWEILNAASPSTVIDSGIITETTGQTIPVNTTDSKFNGKTIIFRVTAYDAAGNKGTTAADDANYTFIVDQETDKPYIGEDSNYTKLDFAQNDINAYYSQTGSKVGNVQKGDSLKFTLYEDDGTAKLKIVNKKLTVTQNGSTYSSNWESNVANLTNVVFDSTQDTPNKLVNVSSYTFPTNNEDCGFYEYAIIAEDNSDSAKRTVKGPFLVRITQDKAAISVKAGKEYAEKDVEVTNTITITPSEGDYKLYRQIVKVGGAYNPSTANADTATSDISQYKLVKNGTKDTFTDAELSANSNTITDSLKIGDYDQENNIIVYYLLLDGAGNASDQKSVTLKIDNDKPEVTIKSPVEGKTNKKALTEVTQFSGKLDDHGKAGTIKVFYKFTNKANPSEAGTVSYPATGYKEEEASDGPFTVDIDYFLKANATQAEKDAVTNAGKTYLTEGKWYFHVYAEDDAGNTSDPVSREFHIDLTEPVLIVTIPDSENCIKKGDIYYFKNTLAGTVKASDTSGQISLDYKVDDTSVEFTQTSTANANEYNWTTDGFGLADAANKFIAGNPQKLTVEVTDPFTKTNTVNLTVYKDTAGPVVTPVNPGNVFGDSVTITATASDAGVGVANVLWSKTSNGTYENLTSAQGSWSKVFASTDLGTDEGEKTLWFKAIDALGNEGTPVSVSFQYDKELPHIISTDTFDDAEINYINKNISGSSFKLTGKAWDSNKLASVQLARNTGNPETLSLTGNIDTATDENHAVTWEKNFKVGSSNAGDSAYLADGTYTFTVYATDIAGRRSSTDVAKRFTVDTKEPALKLNALPGKENTKASSYTFRGTASDGTGSGVEEVYLKISAGTEAGAAYKEVLVEGTDSWSYEVNYNDETEDANGNKWSTVFADEGTKIVTLRAVDYAGNEVTSFKLGNASERTSDTFIFDKANPVLYVNPTTVLEYMPDDGFTITGTAIDSNKLASSNALKVTQVAEKDGSTDTTEKYITSVNGATTIQNWELDVPFNASGTKITPVDGTTYKYKFQLTDEVGNKDTDTPVEYSTTVDKTAPTLSITAPASKTGENSVNETNYQFKGEFVETYIEGIYYQILPSSETAPTASATPLNESSWTGWTKIPSSNLGTTSWNFFQSFKAKNTSGDGMPEGSYKVYLYAVDKAGNVSERSSAAFDVDMKAPVVTLTSTIKDIYNKSDIPEGATSGSFTLSFTVEESNGIQSYEISDGTKTYPPTLSEGTYSYTFTFGSGASGNSKLSEGTHNLKAKVTDIVGKTAEVTKTIVIDTSAPTLSNIKVNGEASSADAWYNTTDMKLTGTAADTGTGVSAVVYKTSTNGTTWSDDIPFVGTSSWNGTVSDVVSNQTRIKIIARDNANNETFEVVGPWQIDINPPTLGTVKEGTTTLSEENAYYSNGTKGITLTITASDGSGESGVDRIYVLPYTKLSAATAVDANKATKSGSNYNFTIDKSKITKSGTVYARIYDKAGNYTDENLFSITYDRVNPVLQSINLSDSFKKDATTYYVNPGDATDDKTFTISGIATDNLAIASVNLVMSVGTGDDYSEKFNDTVTTGDWSFSDIDMSGWGNDKTEVNAVITVTDKAGNALAADNPISATFKIIFDKAAPTAKHELDASDTPKDLYFRIGAQNRDDGSSTNAQGTVTWTPSWVSSKDEDVGAKYSNGTYGNDTSIEIRGRFDDSGSGVKEIFYKIYGTDKTGTDLDSLITEVLDAPNGSFSLREESTKRVFYTRTGSGETAVPAGDTNTNKITVDGKVKYYKDITTNYREKLTGFSEGNNFLVLVAVDNVGNSSVDAVTIGEGSTAVTYPNFSLNIDRTAPTLTSDTTETLYTNAATGKKIELSGSVSDDKAGVSKVVILHPTEKDSNNQPKEEKATLNENETWSYSLDATSLASATEPTSIYAKAYDKAGSGNWTKVEVAKVVVDKAYPVISLDAPDDADESNTTARQINGVIRLTGTASDTIDDTTPNNKFTVTKLLYKKTAKANPSDTLTPADWTDVTTIMPDLSIASSKNYTILNFDTTKLTDKATYQLRAVVEDAAGNKTESTPIEVMVDQDTDRPVITLSNLTLQASGTSYLKSTKTLYLTVTDDDGVQSKEYKVDSGEWQTLSGTSITVDAEGEHTVSFRITDKAGKTFTSTETLEENTPKLTDAAGTTRSENLLFNVVTEAPAVSDIQYSVYDAQSTATTEDAKWSEWSSSAGTVGGTRYTKIKMHLTASSAQKILSATATYNGTQYNFTRTGADDTKPHVWTSGEITIGDADTLTGQQTINLSVKDQVPEPMEYIGSLKIKVDNTKPIITISKPSAIIGQSETLNGEVDETATMYYAVSRFCEMKSDGEGKPQIPDETKPYAETAITPGNAIKKAADNTTVLATKWTELVREDSGLKWNVYFDGKYKEGSNTEFETDHTAKLGTYLTETYLGITTDAEVRATTNPYETKTPVWFWIKAVDSCGNERISKQKLYIDPQGERPTVEITSPVNDDGSIPSMGGRIRLSGMAQDNNYAVYAFIQIDYDGTTGFSQDELTYLKNHGYTIGKISTNHKYANTSTDLVPTNLGTGENAASDYGIIVEVKNLNWYVDLNKTGEFNPNTLFAGEQTIPEKTSLKITVYATDADTTPHKSLPATHTIEIDSKKPYFEESSLELVQYDDSGKIKHRMPYSTTREPNISGIWYLIGSIRDDDSGIAQITYNDEDYIIPAADSTTNSTKPDAVVAGESYTNGNLKFTAESTQITVGTETKTIYNYNFSVPLGVTTPDEVGRATASFSITEKSDSSPTTIPKSYSVTYDNKPPVLTTDTTDPNVQLNRNVQNESGFYTFGAIASETAIGEGDNKVEQSGVKRIAFYFTRDLPYSLKKNEDATIYSLHTATTTRDLFDVMIYHKNNDTDDKASGNMIIGYETETTSWVKENGLYWHKYNATVSGKNVTLSTPNNNIHKKGLAKVSGVIYLIDDVSTDGKTITLSDAPGDTETGETTPVLFAVCNVIDNSEKSGRAQITTHGYGYGYYGNSQTDDGDLMMETFSKQGSDRIFDASINSKNLPDGPITLHIVAFDEAGNYSEWASTPASGQTATDLDFVVSNNAPRIAGMQIGTDENGDGKVEGTEFSTDYSGQYELGYDKSGNEITDITFPVQVTENPKAAITVKGLTVIKPELVGGNGKISYTYKVYRHTSGQTWNTTEEYSKTSATEIATGTTDAVAALTTNIVLPVSDFIGTTNGQDTGNLADNAEGKNGISDGKYKKFEFSFGDSTPGKTETGGISNNATLNVIMNVALRETNAAKNWILPFYWKSKTDNSLFKQSADEGHIELAPDWILANGYNADEAEYDADPKVSGKIKIEGIAQDDTLLREIKVKFGKSMGGLGTTDTPIATYNAASSSWTVTALTDGAISSTSGWASAVQRATYGELVQVGLINAAKVSDDESVVGTTINGTKVEYLSTALVPETSQKFGHVVHWILYLDTALVDGVAATDVTVTATATDRGTPKWNSTTNAPAYTANAAAATGGTAISAAVTKNGNTVNVGALSGNYKVDVVPYIKDIKTQLSGSEKIPSTQNRSASGVYAVRRGETIEISGFNLNAKDTTNKTKVQINGTDVTPNTSTDANKVIIPVTATGLTNGDVDVFVKIGTNSFISSLNNKNSIPVFDANMTCTSIAYNAEPNDRNNDLLSDDRRIYIMDVTKTAYSDVRKVDMAIYGNLVYFASGYQSNNFSSFVQNAQGNYTVYNMRNAYTRYFESKMAVNSDGTIFTVSSSGDSYKAVTEWGNGPSKFGLTRGNFNGEQYNEYPGIKTNGLTTNIAFLDSNWNGADYNNLERELNPDLVVTGNDTLSKLYLSYYDTTQKILKFRYIESGSGTKTTGYSTSNYLGGSTVKMYQDGTETVNNSEQGISVYKTGGKTYNQGFITIAGGNENSPYSSVAVTSSGTAIVSWFDATNKQLKMKYNTSPATSFSGYQKFTTIPTPNNNNTNEYKYTISVDGKAGQEVKVKYKRIGNNTTSRNKHEFAYQLGLALTEGGFGAYCEMDPTDGNVVVRSMQTGTGSKISITPPTGGGSVGTAVDGCGQPWVEKTIDTNEAGKFVAMTVDSKDGIHIAYHATGSADLKYAYLRSVTADPVIVTVDGYQQVGQYIDITTTTKTINGTSCIVPFISYYNLSYADSTSAVKCAYLNRPLIPSAAGSAPTITNDNAKGVVDEKYTGVWEVTNIPCATVPVQYRVNIGVKTNGDVIVGYLGDTIEYVKVW